MYLLSITNYNFKLVRKKRKKNTLTTDPLVKVNSTKSQTASTLLHQLVLLSVCLICPMSGRYSANWDRKGWPGSEIQMYYSCPWKTTFIWLSCYHCNNAGKILIYFSILHFQNTFLELIPNPTYMQNLKNISKKIKAFKIKCIKIKTKNHMSFREYGLLSCNFKIDRDFKYFKDFVIVK